ncbi:relaxase/mobilization nuclease domain-containing protein [Dorea sp. AM58-8]|uniref:relaxase/mobilization nuclease domain-containing protein n=1 Tax=Dorea sp. AM58-8 TaxID=2292346 RepID=UPI000E52260B|nr:relaxase/mobilization nuclease domain-containing protein [Dorea sp. AM58-8]RGY83358.1 rlx protein [Dorea sp. AM58-8]
MAILKHIASKNANYGEAQRYLLFQYDEHTKKPILDKNGELIPRKEYYIDGINCDPFSFDLECKELNAQYHKNQNFDEIKSHHYILSFDPKDAEEHGLTGEKAQQLGLEYAQKTFPGHQALVCTHTDGNNESGNIHVHIVINSLRKYDVEHQTFMERPCDARAGYKHHLTPSYLIYLKRSLMHICHREHLHQVDLLSPVEKKITDREYRAKHTGQKKLDTLNKEMLSKGIAPRQTVFQTQKEYLRTAIEYAAASSCNIEEFQATLLKNYQITLKVSRGRFSYLHPERNKFITGRSLGSHYTEDYLFSIWEKKKEPQHQSHTRSDIFTPHSNSTTSAFMEQKETEAFCFIKSDLRLVIDLQQRAKAQSNPVYDRKVKLSNLQQMAKTIAYVQERGYSTEDDLITALTTSQSETANCRKNLRSTQQELKRINEQIHYTGQYLANKSVYREFLHAKNKKQFRQEHLSEITLYETARNFLKQQAASEKLPSMKLLKSEKEKLLSIKNMQHQEYQKRKQYEKELQTVCKNVEMILHGRSDFEKSSEKNLPPR